MAGRNFLFVPGPTNVPDRVLRAMVVAMEDHRSSKFPELTRTLFPDLKKLFNAADGQVFIFPSTGTGALAGTYIGASVRAAIIGGTGLNALVGGFQNSVALQPLSVEGNSGFYLGGGIGIMDLKAGEREY